MHSVKKELLGLSPKLVWKHFATLCSIPRPSHHESQISQYLVTFGKELGLETISDKHGNVVIKKPATPGMENRQTIVLQSHMDIVPQKTKDKKHDFAKDPIDAYIDGDWVTANGTTLGADNGAGLAASMAVLEATDIEHGPIEVLVTIDEEDGMEGAGVLTADMLDGDILLNLDSESDKELYIGCAGGINTDITFKYQEESTPDNVKAFNLRVFNLKGGHSGADIHRNRPNAIKMLNRLLLDINYEIDIRLAEIQGGTDIHNAIPREANAIVVIPNTKEQDFVKLFTKLSNEIKDEFAISDPDMQSEAKSCNIPSKLIDSTTQYNLLRGIYSCPNDVIRMNDSMPGLVETSSTMAYVNTANGIITIYTLQRSSVDSGCMYASNMVRSAFELAKATNINQYGKYPGWNPNLDSPILKLAKDLFIKRYGEEPYINAIHAGLECGLLGSIFTNMDMISFGCVIEGAHSPDERVYIPSMENMWNFLLDILKHVPKK